MADLGAECLSGVAVDEVDVDEVDVDEVDVDDEHTAASITTHVLSKSTFVFSAVGTAP